MELNPSPKVRKFLYVVTALGTPVAVYLQAKGLIGDLEFVLWGAESTIVAGMAALNTSAE